MIARPRVLLLLAIAVQVAVFVVAQRDVPVDDPLAYAENAYWLGTDPAGYFAAPPNHPFVMRVGVTLPLAAIYKAFGVSQWTTNLPCLLAAIVVVFVVYLVAPTARAERIGLGFASASSALVLHGTELNADLLCGAVTAVSLLLLSRRRLTAAVVVWFAAFLVKETTIWFAPAWLYVVVTDVRAAGWRGALRRYAPALVVGAALVTAYVAVCWRVWCDPLARLHGIDALANRHIWTPHDKSSAWWVYRLTVGPPWMYLSTFGTALVVGLVGAPRITGRDRVWVVATASFLLMYWFGSGASGAYLPLPLAQRRMLMVALPGVLVIATLASDALRSRRWIAAAVVAVTALAFTRTLVRAVRRDRPETALHRVIRADVAAPGNVLVVCPDVRCIAAVPFAFGYKLPSNLRLIHLVDFARAPPPAADTRVRVVVKRVRPQVATYGDAEAAQTIDALGLPRRYWHRDLRLYDAGDGARLHEALRR